MQVTWTQCQEGWEAPLRPETQKALVNVVMKGNSDFCDTSMTNETAAFRVHLSLKCCTQIGITAMDNHHIGATLISLLYDLTGKILPDAALCIVPSPCWCRTLSAVTWPRRDFISCSEHRPNRKRNCELATRFQCRERPKCWQHVYRLFKAVHYLHSINVLHSDLKPSNVLSMRPDPALIDFSAAEVC
jgi:hypothetical protein